MGENGLISKVELDGFNPNGVMSAIQMRGKLRGLASEGGDPLLQSHPPDVGRLTEAAHAAPARTEVDGGESEPCSTVQRHRRNAPQLMIDVRA